MSEDLFRRRTRLILIAVALLSLGAGFYFAIFGKSLAPPPFASPSAYSKSAVGHKAIVNLLAKLEVPVVVSRWKSGEQAANAVLVMAEPNPDTDDLLPVWVMLRRAERTLVVLPKWDSSEGLKAGWIDSADLYPKDSVNRLLKELQVSTEITRPKQAEWNGELGAVPSISSPQLMRSDFLEPVISTRSGDMLLAVHPQENIWVLSDPDLLSNHGLGKGENAVLSIAIIRSIQAEPGQSIVFDETLHGLAAKPSMWRSLFEFPLSLATLQMAVLGLFVLWAAMKRFGRALPTEPPHKAGKGFLIDNTASLLRVGGHSAETLLQYYNTSLSTAARALHAPSSLFGQELIAWLDRVGEGRGVSDSAKALATEATEAARDAKRNPRRVANAALRIHKWKEEMIYGSSRHSDAA